MKFAVDTEWEKEWDAAYDESRRDFGLNAWDAARFATEVATPDFPVEKIGFDLLCKKRGWK